MLFYGKSVIGLADDLNIPIGMTELLDLYSNDCSNYLDRHKIEYLNYINTYYNGKSTNAAKKDFLKQEYLAERFLPEVQTASKMVDLFYNTFPNIQLTLSSNADSAVINGHIATMDPFKRKRFFTPPTNPAEEAAIKRQAMNSPIQGGGANMTKYSIILTWHWLKTHKHLDKVKFCWPTHDETMWLVREDFAETFAVKHQEFMEKAGEVCLGHNYQKAEGGLHDMWVK
jgi:hypothetical protein